MVMEQKDAIPCKMKNLTLENLIGKKDKEIIKEELMVKVQEVREVDTRHNFRKVVVDDGENVSEITFWREDTKIAGTLHSGDCIGLKNVRLNCWNVQQNNKTIPGINFGDRHPISILRKLSQDEMPEGLKNIVIQQNVDNIVTTGIILDFDELIEYKSCPGTGGSNKCGKKVTDGQQICSRAKCGIDLKNIEIFDDYKVTLVIMQEDQELIKVTAFRRALLELETDGNSVQEKLSDLKNQNITVCARNPNKEEDDPILSELTLL